MKKRLPQIAPILFPILWSTGFIGSRLSAPYADPFLFLSYRFLLTVILLAPIAYFLKQNFPRKPKDFFHISIVGVCIHATYLGAIFYVVREGFPIAICSLIMSLQPILTSVFASFFLKEKVSKKQWLGLVLGFVGFILVILSRMDWSQKTFAFDFEEIPYFVISVFGLMGITIGTIYQKRFCKNVPFVSGAMIQYSASAVVLLFFSWMLEPMVIIWNFQSIFALGWLVLVLSIGAIFLLLFLIRENATTTTTSLFYLVPILVAIEGFFLFGESMNLFTWIGMGIILYGVFLVVKKKDVSRETKNNRL